MKYEKQCKAVIRKIVRQVKVDPYVCIRVDDWVDGETIYFGTKEVDILNTIFGIDESEVSFIDLTTSRELGRIAIALDYETTPEEIIYDYLDNAYTALLIEQVATTGA